MAKYFRHVDNGSKETTIVLPSGEIRKDIVRNIRQSAYTDAEIMAELPARLRLTADKLRLTADGIDEVVVTVELVSAPLTDDSQASFKRAEMVAMLVDGVETILQLDAMGRGTLEISAADVGDEVLVIVSESHAGNTIEIEVHE